MGIAVRDERKKTALEDLVTISDLDIFREKLLVEIKQVFSGRGGQMEKKWLKSSEVRKQLGVSISKLQTMRKCGDIVYMKIGGSIYYDQVDIDKMSEEGKVTK